MRAEQGYGDKTRRVGLVGDDGSLEDPGVLSAPEADPSTSMAALFSHAPGVDVIEAESSGSGVHRFVSEVAGREPLEMTLPHPTVNLPGAGAHEAGDTALAANARPIEVDIDPNGIMGEVIVTARDLQLTKAMEHRDALSLWQRRDAKFANAVPVEPYGLRFDAQDAATTQLVRLLPPVLVEVTDSIFAEVLDPLARGHSEANYVVKFGGVKDGKKGVEERFFGNRVPHKVIAGRNERLADLTQASGKVGLESVAAHPIDPNAATVRALKTLGVPIALTIQERIVVDDEEITRDRTFVDGMKFALAVEGKVPVPMTADMENALAMEAELLTAETDGSEAPISPLNVVLTSALKVIARRDTVFRIKGGRGSTYETQLLIAADDGSRLLLAGSPELTQAPGSRREPVVLTEVGAFAIHPNIVDSVQQHLNGQRTNEEVPVEAGLGAKIKRAPRVEADLIGITEGLMNAQRVGIRGTKVEIRSPRRRVSNVQAAAQLAIEASPTDEPEVSGDDLLSGTTDDVHRELSE
ncbi:MAG: hypothetical protein V4702_02430 [Patescibacteria group bacterium]